MNLNYQTLILKNKILKKKNKKYNDIEDLVYRFQQPYDESTGVLYFVIRMKSLYYMEIF